MAEARRMDRLTAQDLFMLWTDDYGRSQDIGALAILDGPRLLDPDGRVRIDEVRPAAGSKAAPGPALPAAAVPAPAGAGLALVGRRPRLRPRRSCPGLPASLA